MRRHISCVFIVFLTIGLLFAACNVKTPSESSSAAGDGTAAGSWGTTDAGGTQPRETAGGIVVEQETADDFNGFEEEDLQKYFSWVLEMVESYTIAAIENESRLPDLRLSFDDTAAQYVWLRYESEALAGRQYEGGTYSVLEWAVSGGALLCKVAVSVDYYYVSSGVPLDTMSGSRYVEEILLVNPKKPTVTDWYNGKPNSFDSQVRQDELDLTDPANWLVNQDFDGIEAKARSLIAAHNPNRTSD